MRAEIGVIEPGENGVRYPSDCRHMLFARGFNSLTDQAQGLFGERRSAHAQVIGS